MLLYQLNCQRGAIFHFSHQIGLKSTKSMRFCALHKPMGGARAPPAPPGYATGGVLEDVLGLEDVLEDTFWSPWPRGLIVLENWPCPRLEDSTIFWIVKILWGARKIFWKTFFCGDRLKNVCEDLFFFWRALALVSLVLGLGLEHSCPWPRECLSSERLSLASDFFRVLSLCLEPCVLESTSVTCAKKWNQHEVSKSNQIKSFIILAGLRRNV